MSDNFIEIQTPEITCTIEEVTTENGLNAILTTEIQIYNPLNTDLENLNEPDSSQLVQDSQTLLDKLNAILQDHSLDFEDIATTAEVVYEGALNALDALSGASRELVRDVAIRAKNIGVVAKTIGIGQAIAEEGLLQGTLSSGAGIMAGSAGMTVPGPLGFKLLVSNTLSNEADFLIDVLFESAEQKNTIYQVIDKLKDHYGNFFTQIYEDFIKINSFDGDIKNTANYINSISESLNLTKADAGINSPISVKILDDEYILQTNFEDVLKKYGYDSDQLIKNANDWMLGRASDDWNSILLKEADTITITKEVAVPVDYSPLVEHAQAQANGTASNIIDMQVPPDFSLPLPASGGQIPPNLGGSSTLPNMVYQYTTMPSSGGLWGGWFVIAGLGLGAITGGIGALLTAGVAGASTATIVTTSVSAKIAGCPLSLDLDGDGIETLDTDDKDIYFNTKNSSFQERTGWLKGDDGFLAVDKDGNGLIESQSELFGSSTTKGFDDLKDYDSNNDNIIDSNDAQFNELKVWQDINENAVTDAGELQSLSEVGIVSINLDYQNIDEVNNNNTITEKATFTWADNTQGNIYDVNFAISQIYTRYNGDYELDSDVLDMPWIRGYGQVVDLQLGMSQNAGLKTLVTELVEIFDSNELYGRMDELLAKWTGIEEAIPDENTMNGYVNAREAGIVSKFLNLDIQNVTTEQKSYIENSYKEIKNKLFVDLIAQTQVGNAFEINYDFTTDAILYNDNTYKKLVTNLINEDAFRASYLIAGVLGKSGALDINKLIANIKNEGYGSALISYLNGGFQILESDEIQYLNPNMAHYITGTTQNDTITGDDNVDIIYGLDGDDLLEGKNGDDFLVGGSGDDILNGGDGDDTLSGGAGDDTLNGGAGDDTYIYDGEGADVVIDERWVKVAKQEWYQTGWWIFKKWESRWVYSDVLIDAGQDTVIFNQNVTQNDIKFTRNGNDLVLELLNTDNKLTMKNWYTSTEQRIEKFVLPNGVVIKVRYEGTENSETLNGDLFHNIMNGYEGNDIIYGRQGNDTIDGGDGNDVIAAGEGSDIINGGLGNDIIYGEDSNDSITGGKGDDSLYGGEGVDTYYYYRGDGQDTIEDSFYDIIYGGYGPVNKLVFGENITKDDLEFSYSGNDLIIGFKDSIDKITVKNNFNPNTLGTDTYYKLQKLIFADGSELEYGNVDNAAFYGDTTRSLYDHYELQDEEVKTLSNGNDSYTGSGHYNGDDDVVFGLAGNDVLTGSQRSCVFVGGIGNDLLNGGVKGNT